MIAKWKEGHLFRNNKEQVLENNDNTSYLKVQAWIRDDVTFKFRVVGRLSKENIRRSPILATADRDADDIYEISDNGIYTLDITGYYDVSIEVVENTDTKNEVIVWGVIMQES